MLEDDYTYVLRKALLGHSLTPSTAALQAGIAEAEVLAFLDGEFSPETARVLAGLLNLNSEMFSKHPFYQPAEISHPGIHRMVLPFNGDHVNAWVLSAGDSAVLFDSGDAAEGLLSAMNSQCGHVPALAWITHAHRDHIGGVGELLAAGVPVFGPEGCGTPLIQDGEEMVSGRLRVRACDLSGHAVPALGYHVEGLGVPVLVTGDALFAGSIGGCPTPSRYQLALSRLREVLGPLQSETILLPGHGPATTLGEERLANPFL